VCIHFSHINVKCLWLIQFPRWLYRRSLVVDGNFSMEHMRMKKSEDDVFLNDGEGYMVQLAPYQQHLETSVETNQVSALCICSVHELMILSACHVCQPQGC
jgi:hypothetical protein